jgi:glucose-1-phosphate cytidylyltransferase
MTKLVILAGGLGTRLAEETEVRPKPMVEIGGKPILWHIMKSYAQHGVREFVVCLGYKGYVIKEYFANYFLHEADVTIDLAQNKLTVHDGRAEDWCVTLVDTGAATMTGGRLKRVAKYVAGETFCMTYGDGVGDVDITALLAAHKAGGRLATVTAVKPPGRFGALDFDQDGQGDRVTGFIEKPRGDGGWINGGFFVLEPETLDYVDGDETIWEQQPLQGLARDGQLNAFRHEGFWQPMDTVRDRLHLEELWSGDKAPWKTW